MELLAEALPQVLEALADRKTRQRGLCRPRFHLSAPAALAGASSEAGMSCCTALPFSASVIHSRAARSAAASSHLAHRRRDVGAQLGGAVGALDRGDVQPLVGGDQIDWPHRGRSHTSDPFRRRRRRWFSPPMVAIRSILHFKACHRFCPCFACWLLTALFLPFEALSVAVFCGFSIFRSGGFSPLVYGFTMPNGFQYTLKMHD